MVISVAYLPIILAIVSLVLHGWWSSSVLFIITFLYICILTVLSLLYSLLVMRIVLVVNGGVWG